MGFPGRCTRHAWYNMTVAQVNRKLVEMGVPPLTNLVEGYDENGIEIDNVAI